MEYLCIIILSIIMILVTIIVFKINMKQIIAISKNEKLNEIAEKYPSNTEICKKILKILKNEGVKIEKTENSDTTLYIAITNKISIANNQTNFTRIQTMAHECLHSIQPRRLLIFNFIYTNIYLIFYAVPLILIVFKIANEKHQVIFLLAIFLILSFLYYVVRIYLENDAMFKAKYLAKEYMESENISDKDEIYEVIQGYEQANSLSIKTTNVQFFVQILIKVIIFSLLALIF